MREGRRGWAAPAAMAGAVLLGIYLAGTWAAYFRPEGSSVAFWWPGAGLSVALVAALPRRWAPALGLGIAVVSVAANLTGGQTPELSLAFGVANAAEALVAGLMLKDRSGRMLGLTQLSDFLRLVLAAAVGALTIGVIAAGAARLLGQGDFLPTLGNLVTSHMTAVMVIVPVVMAWPDRAATAGPLEYVAQVTTLAATVAVVFGPVHSLPVSFVVLPPLVWAALRLGPLTVTLELLLSSLVAIVLTAQGRGAFGQLAPGGQSAIDLGAPVVQGYILATALVTLPLTLAVTQRARALAALTERERLFRRNFSESMTGMLLLALRGDRLEIIDANETAHQMLAEDSLPLVGRYLDRVLSHASTLRSVARQMVRGDLDGWRGQMTAIHRPGSNVKVALAPLGGEELAFSAQLLDVGAEYAALARTAAAERLTSATLDTTACIILVTDLEGTVIRVNRATTALTGFEEPQLLGQPVWARLLPAQRVPIAQELFASRDGTGLPATREADVQTRSGDPLRVVWNSDLVRDEDGAPRYVVMTGVDVTVERNTSGLMTSLFQAGISTAIIGLDSRGRITLFNSGAQALLGWTAEEIQGRQFTEVLDPDELAERTGDSGGPGWAAVAATIGEDSESTTHDWTWRTASGVRRTVAMTVSGGSSEAGPQAGYLVVGRDVTEQRHSQVMLMAALQKERMAADRLRELDTAKNEFVSTVSHELRTPVTSIVGYAELLADGSPVLPDPEQLPLLETIARNGARLIALCNDLLTLAGLDSDGPAWNRVEVDLRDLVAQVNDAVQPLLRDRDVEVSFVVPDHGVPVLGDSIQLERVLLNLLSNAVKFTPDGGRVTTAVEIHGSEAWLVVADTGIGIPHDEQEALFQRFFRASTAQDLAIQGTGLGLSIAAGIVAVHGGRVSVDSEPGAGTTFTVRLPLLVP